MIHRREIAQGGGENVPATFFEAKLRSGNPLWCLAGAERSVKSLKIMESYRRAHFILTL
jgi:hypothetical protein